MTHPTHGLDPNALEAALTDRERIAAMAAAYPDAVADLTWAEIDEVLAALSQNPGTSNTSGEAVGVRGLEWSRDDVGNDVATTICGPYVVWTEGIGAVGYWSLGYGGVRTQAPDRAAAKAAAQGDYEQRVLSSLASSERSGREAEYVPTIIRNDGAGFYEFVTEDVPALYSGMMAANVERIGNLKGDLIGFRIYDPLEPRASDREAVAVEALKQYQAAIASCLTAGGVPINDLGQPQSWWTEIIEAQQSGSAAIRKLSEVSHEH